MKNSPELRKKLTGVNPDDERTITNLAEDIGEDEVILAAIALAFRTNRNRTH